jgi:hypothetical protein
MRESKSGGHAGNLLQSILNTNEINATGEINAI